MVQIEQIDNATQIVTDPRFGPPSGVSWLESSSQSELSNWLLIAGIVILGLILALAMRHQKAD